MWIFAVCTPYVLKYERYPISHPTCVTNDFSPLFKVCRRMQPCPLLGTAVCPRMALEDTLFWFDEGENFASTQVTIPVLPIKISGKLMFLLCHVCAENEDKTLHQPSQSHALIHTWCTLEITLAINMGYDILEIYEVLHWPSNEKNDNSMGKGGLFTK